MHLRWANVTLLTGRRHAFGQLFHRHGMTTSGDESGQLVPLFAANQPQIRTMLAL